MKTYFIKNRTGEVVTITAPALYVWNVHQDLMSGKACNRAIIRIVLDLDPDIAGLYPLDKEKQQHIEESIPFIDDPTDLYLNMNCPNRNIRESIPFTKGMEKLLKYRYSGNEKCTGCMIGKRCHQDFPGPAKRATRQLEKVTFDLII